MLFLRADDLHSVSVFPLNVIEAKTELLTSPNDRARIHVQAEYLARLRMILSGQLLQRSGSECWFDDSVSPAPSGVASENLISANESN